MYSQYISPFGYQTGTHGIDSYGVNHKDFDIRDEIEYQFARTKRENELMEQYKSLGITDKFPQYGQGGADIAELASNIRETYDRETASNTLDSSIGDQYANMIGRFLGGKYPNGDCNELIQKYIKRKY